MLFGTLSGCATTKIKYIPVPPPAHFLAPCGEAYIDAKTGKLVVNPPGFVEPQTNGELAKAYLDTRYSLDACNIQLTGIRLWVTELKGTK